jgi:hypothetical protein
VVSGITSGLRDYIDCLRFVFCIVYSWFWRLVRELQRMPICRIRITRQAGWRAALYAHHVNIDIRQYEMYNIDLPKLLYFNCTFYYVILSWNKLTTSFCKIQPECVRAALHQRQCVSYEAYPLTTRTHSGSIVQHKLYSKLVQPDKLIQKLVEPAKLKKLLKLDIVLTNF